MPQNYTPPPDTPHQYLYETDDEYAKRKSGKMSAAEQDDLANKLEQRRKDTEDTKSRLAKAYVAMTTPKGNVQDTTSR